MSIKINFPTMLAAGGLSLFKLEDGNHVLVIAHKKGCEICPVIGKRIYIETEDESTLDTIEEIVKNITTKNIFPELNAKNLRVGKAPEFNKIIKGMVPAKGLRKFKGIEEILESNGYTFNVETKTTSAIKRDYSALLKSNDFARAIYEENKAELAKVGATFDKVSPEVKMAYQCISSGESDGIILAGPTGTGKSWLARIIADQLKAPLWTFQIQGGTTTDSLVGSFVPKAGERPSAEVAAKIVDIIRDKDLSVTEAIEKAGELIKVLGEQAKWEFVPGPLFEAFKSGYVLCLEEVNFGDSRVLAVLNQFTDGTLRVTINGVPYKKNPNFCVIMTMNPGYAGTDPLNVALKGRFTIVQVPALTKTQFVERASAFSQTLGHRLSDEFFNRLFDFAAKIERLAGDTGYHEDVHFSIRNAQRFCLSILTKSCSSDEFAAAVAIEYLNHLSLDNDNSDRLQRLKNDESILSDISRMYELYDYAEIPVADELADWSDFVTITTSAESSDDNILDEDDLDELLGKVGSKTED